MVRARGDPKRSEAARNGPKRSETARSGPNRKGGSRNGPGSNGKFGRVEIRGERVKYTLRCCAYGTLLLTRGIAFVDGRWWSFIRGWNWQCDGSFRMARLLQRGYGRTKRRRALLIDFLVSCKTLAVWYIYATTIIPCVLETANRTVKFSLQEKLMEMEIFLAITVDSQLYVSQL